MAGNAKPIGFDLLNVNGHVFMQWCLRGILIPTMTGFESAGPTLEMTLFAELLLAILWQMLGIENCGVRGAASGSLPSSR